MKTKYFMLAAAAALFAACSSDELDLAQSPKTQVTDDGSINFSAYVNRGTTRSGYEGTLDNDALEEGQALGGGFGVFSYYTNGEPYSENAKPDFMYNQGVFKSGSDWAYSPIKYWPNEFGSTAASDGRDKLTFFAYAPYVVVNTSTGLAANQDYGIVALTRNTAHGDPFVKYYATMDPDKRVDLCFGVAKTAFNSSVDDTNSPNNVVEGKPYIDITKPKVGDKINFDFKHALAAINVQIDADIDEVSHGTTNYKDDKTKIYVRSVTFEGFTNKGMLNLNSDGIGDYVPNWYDLSGINKIGSGTVTIYDGRRDGKEGQVNATASNELPNDLNPDIIQSESSTPGVPATEKKNLFNSSTASTPIFVIPTGENMKVTIVYDVETADPNLPSYLSDGTTKGSSVENVITKEITVGGAPLTLGAGKAYNISLHLGMTSVKFEASVTGWPDPATDADNTDLPINSPASFSVTPPTAQAATGGSLAVSVKDPSNTDVNMTTGFTFATTYSDNNGHSNVDVALSATGSATGFTVTLPALSDFYGRVYKVVITKTASGEKQIVNITQNPPEVSDITASYSDPTITLSTPTVTPTIAWGWTNITVVDDSTGDPVAVTNNNDRTLTIASLPTGDYTITITNGDVVTVAALNVP